MNNNKKYELFLEICDFYDYKVSEENGKMICRHDEENYFEYKDIDEALCDWYSTLMDSNENHEEYNEINRYTVWSKEEIDFIRCLIRDKALDVVASYAQVLDISIKEINSEHTFDVVITSEKEGKTTVNKMDDYCRIFIDEINTLIDIEHDENKKTSLINMRNIMLDYKYMIKEYGAELVDIGKLVKSWVETREFYEYVVWEDFSDETYMDMGYKIYKEKGILEELIELEESEDGYPSDRAIDLLIDIVDLGVEREGYEFDDHKDGFIKSCIGKVNEVCNSCKKEVSLEDRYDLQKCPNCGEEVLPQDSQSKIVVEKIHDVDEVNQVDEERYDFQMYFDFENSDAINEYFIDWMEGFHFIGCVVDKKDGVFDLDNCEIDMVWNGNNSEKFPFTDEQIRTIKDKVIKEIKDNNMEEIKYSEYKVKENQIDKDMVNNMSTLKVKYDVEFKYMGTELVGVGEYYKVECNRPIPCVKDGKLELVTNIYCNKTTEETVAIKYIEINNILHHIKDIKYWFGINTEELFEKLELVISSNTNPSNYIKIDDNIFPIEDIANILDLNVSGNINECKFSEGNENIYSILEHYMVAGKRNIDDIKGDLNIILAQINDDMDTLDELLKINSNPNYWTKENIYYYEGYKRWEAIEEYLEYEENIPNKVLDYLDLENFLDKETIISEVLELNDCVILY